MKKLILRDVGDGLNLLIKKDGIYNLVVDFGGDKNLDCFVFFIDSFLLTHFHNDHYNGILKCNANNSLWYLNNFYHPIMPKFQDNKLFFMYLLAMNIRVTKNHPIQNTILGFVRKLNRTPLNFIPIGTGDIIFCGNSKYEILWPPKELKEEDTLMQIKTAIIDFERAKEIDSTLKDIYQNIEKLYSDKNINELNEIEIETATDAIQEETSNEFSETIRTANDSLRRAANRLSVAFRQDDNILFLGDLEKNEINHVVDELVKQHKITYKILIAAHHGTHWGNSLKSIKCKICLASVGESLRSHIKNDYKNISNKFIRTDLWGDIKILNKVEIK